MRAFACLCVPLSAFACLCVPLSAFACLCLPLRAFVCLPACLPACLLAFFLACLLACMHACCCFFLLRYGFWTSYFNTRKTPRGAGCHTQRWFRRRREAGPWPVKWRPLETRRRCPRRPFRRVRLGDFSFFPAARRPFKGCFKGNH